MISKSTFSFANDIILRSPALPFRSGVTAQEVLNLTKDKGFMEALFLATPVLHQQAELLSDMDIADPKRPKIIQSLTKYFLRMSTRSTPFGLFSGCSSTGWLEKGEPILLGQQSRKTRLDMQYLCDLIRQLGKDAELRTELIYFPNTSHYRIGKEVRYSECNFIHGLRQHTLSSIDFSEYLDEIITSSRNGCHFKTLVLQLENQGIEKQEALDYLNELIDYQVLVSELEPKITGKEYIHQITEVLTGIITKNSSDKLTAILNTLTEISIALRDLDLKFDNDIEKYRAVIAMISTLGIDFDENKLFQTDMARDITGGGLDSSIKDQLIGAVEILSRICSPSKRHKIVRFAKAFSERYNTQEIPLLNVMDPETGLGYGVTKNQYSSPLTERIQLDNRSDSTEKSQISWDPLQRWIFSKLMDTTKNGLYEVAVEPEEIANFKSHLEDFPASTSIVFKKIDHQDFSICIEGVGGTSAGNLLGRFGHNSPEINRSITSIIEHETTANTNVLFCEIVHLPESRVGNILLRPSYHKYEIPYLAQSSKPDEFTITLDDIMVSVCDDVVYLRSKKLNKRIIPRLTSAHNSSFKTLPLYEFLCDIQTQNQCVGTYFNWGSLSIEFPFLPRLTFQKTVLFPATWGFAKTDVAHFFGLPENSLPAAISDFRKKWNLPALIILIDGDNELLVDLENPLSVTTWLSTILKKDKIVIREYLMPVSKDFLSNDQGQLYAHQFIASLLNHKEVYETHNSHRFTIKPNEETIYPRAYSFGSEWLYYKIYCGINTADKIITEILSPLFKTLEQQGLTDKFYFIRYEDPKPHLRVRFHLTNTEAHMPLVSKIINDSLNTEEAKAHIWQIQIDPYVRELERYGSSNIDQVESVFHIDSEAFLSFLGHAFDADLATLRWMYVVKSIDILLSDFGYTNTDKISFFKSLENAFSLEFSVDKKGKISMDRSYRDLRNSIENALNLEGTVNEFDLNSLHAIFSERSSKMSSPANHLKAVNTKEQLNNIVNSLIHMIVNRGMNTNTRQNEFAIYNHLLKAYISRNAIEKKVSLV